MPRTQERITSPERERRKNLSRQIFELDQKIEALQERNDATDMSRIISNVSNRAERQRLEMQRGQLVRELAEFNRDTETVSNETPAEHGRDVVAKAGRETTDLVVRGAKIVEEHREIPTEKADAILAVGSEASDVYTLTRQQLDTVIAKAVARALEAEAAKKAAAPDAAAGTGGEAGAPAKKRASKKKPGGAGAEGAGGTPPPGSTEASAAEEPEDEGKDTEVATLGFIGKLLSIKVKSIDALKKLGKKFKERIHDHARSELPRMMSDLTEDQRKDILAKLEELNLIDPLPAAAATPTHAPARPAGASRTAAESAPVPAPATTRTSPEATPTASSEAFSVARVLTALEAEVGGEATWKEGIVEAKDIFNAESYNALDKLNESQIAQVFAEIERRVSAGTGAASRVETTPAAGRVGAGGTTSRVDTGATAVAATGTTPRVPDTTPTVPPGTIAPARVGTTPVAASATGAPASRAIDAASAVVAPAPVAARELTRRDSKVESYEHEMEALNTAIETFTRTLSWDQFGEPGRNLFPKIAEIVRAFAPKLGFSDNQDIVALANNYYEKLLEKVEETLKIGIAKANEKKVTEIFGINLKEEGKQLVRSFAGGGLYGGAMRIASGLTRVTEKVLTTAFLPARLVAMGVGAVHGFIAGGLSATATEVGAQGGKDLVSLAKNLRSKGLKRSTGGHTQEEKIKSLYRDFTAGMQRAQEANDTTKLEYLDTIQQNLSKGVGENLHGLVSFDMRRHIQIADIRAMKEGVTFATGGSADIDQLLQYAENGRFKNNKKERDEREKLLTKVSSNDTLRALIRSAIKKENDRLLAEEGEAGLTPEQKKEVTKRAILSIERTMNALLGDLVVQEKTSGLTDGLTERYGLEYASKIFGNEPPETWTQRFLRGGVNGAIAGAIMRSGPEAAAIYMGLTRFGSGIRTEMLKRRGDDRPVRTADEVFRGLAVFTAGATIDVGSARDKIIDARARIKLPDMKEADRARIEDAIDALERAMMKRGVLEAVADENNEVLKIKYQNVEASKKATALAKDEKARKAWLFSKEAILVKYAKMFTEKGSSWEATKILAKSGMVGTFSAMAGALGAGAVDVGWEGVEAYRGGQNFDIGTEFKVTMGSAVDRATFGATDVGTTVRAHEIETKLGIDIDNGYDAGEQTKVATLSERDQALVQLYVNHLVHDGKLVPIDGEYQKPEVVVEAMKSTFFADNAIQADELAIIREMPDSVRTPVLAHIESLVIARTLVAVTDAGGNIVAYEAPRAVTAEPPAPEAEKPAEMNLVESTNPHNRRDDDKGLEPQTWCMIEGFADEGQEYMTINPDVKGAVGKVMIRVEGGSEVNQMVQEWIDTSELRTKGEIRLTGEERGGERLFIAGAKSDTAVLIFRPMTTGHPEDGIEMMCETRHADRSREYDVEGVGIVNGAFDGAIRGAVKTDAASDSAQTNTQRYHSDVHVDTNHDGTLETATAIEFKANQYGDERVSAYEYTDLDDAETHTVDVAVADHDAKPGEQKYVSQEMGSDAPEAILHGAYENGECVLTVDQDLGELIAAAEARNDIVDFPETGTAAEQIAAADVIVLKLNSDPFDYNPATHEFTYWNGKGFDCTSLSVPEGASVVEDRPGHFQVKIGSDVMKEGVLSFNKTTSTWTMEDKGTSTNLDEFDDDVDTAVLDYGVAEHPWIGGSDKDENIAILKNVGAFDEKAQHFTFAGFDNEAAAQAFVEKFRDVIDGTNPEEVGLAYTHRTEDPRTIERIIEDAPMLEARLGITTLEGAFQFEEERFPDGTKFEALTANGTDGVKVDRPGNLPDLFIDSTGIHAINAQSGEHEYGPAVLVDNLVDQDKLDTGINKAVALLATQEAAKLAVGTFAVGETPLLSDADVKDIRGSTWENLTAEEWAPNDVRAGAREEVRANIMEKLLALHVVVKQGGEYVPDPAYLAARHHTAAEFKAMTVDDILEEAVTNNAQAAEYVVKVSAGVRAVEAIVDAGKQGGWAPDLSRGVVPHVLVMDARTVEGLTDAQYAKEIARLAGWSWMGTQQDNLENVHKEIVKIMHELDKKQADMPAGEKTPAQKMQEYGITLPVRPNVGEVLQAYEQLQMFDTVAKTEAAAPTAAVVSTVEAAPTGASVVPEMEFRTNDPPIPGEGSTQWKVRSVRLDFKITSIEHIGTGAVIPPYSVHEADKKDYLGNPLYVDEAPGSDKIIRIFRDTAGRPSRVEETTMTAIAAEKAGAEAATAANP